MLISHLFLIIQLLYHAALAGKEKKDPEAKNGLT